MSDDSIGRADLAALVVNSDMLTSDEIPWGTGGLSGPTPWPDHDPVVQAAIAHLPAIVDDDIAAIVEFLLDAILDRKDELRAVRLVLSVMGDTLHETTRELERVRGRHNALLDERRADRTAPEAD